MRIRSRATQGLLAALLIVSVLAVAGCQPNPVTLSGHLEATDPAMSTTNVQVAVYADDAETLVAETRTRSGAFAFHADVLPPGTYRVRFSDADWWQGAADWQSATPIVAADGAAPLDATVDVATATFTGVNIALGIGKQLPYSGAGAYNAETGAFVGSAVSEPYEPFQLVVPTGTYYVKSGIYWNGSSVSHHGATPITVTAGQTVDLGVIGDAVGPVYWSVSGVVTGGGAPLNAAHVYIFEADGGYVAASTVTDHSGRFTVNVNPTVEYKALVVDPSGTYQAVTWGAPDVTATGGTTFSVPTGPPVPGLVDLGTQDLQPLTP